MAEDRRTSIRNSHWLVFKPSEGVYFSETNTTWKLSPFLSERVLHGDEVNSVEISEASGVCIATQIDGPLRGREAILKVRMQIPPWYDQPGECSRDKAYYAKFKSNQISHWADHEINILDELTKKGCSCTPKLLSFATQKQRDTDWVPGGYIVFILMEKLPGRDLTAFDTFSPDRRYEVRIAFGRAIRELHALGYWHQDPDKKNALWDEESKKCFILDMEDVTYEGKRIQFVPKRDYGRWGIDRDF
ncbi:hypothetical protein VTN02DRAFT_4770 [Thermoascus thermophilus]